MTLTYHVHSGSFLLFFCDFNVHAGSVRHQIAKLKSALTDYKYGRIMPWIVRRLRPNDVVYVCRALYS
jgi:uncharacterized membrane protein